RASTIDPEYAVVLDQILVERHVIGQRLISGSGLHFTHQARVFTLGIVELGSNSTGATLVQRAVLVATLERLNGLWQRHQLLPAKNRSSRISRNSQAAHWA